jgi:signal transduction histidine kinase/integral membrane sensor domain MASE1
LGSGCSGSHHISQDDRGIVTPLTTEWTVRQIASAALLTAGAYWLGARVGLALTFGPTPVSVLWPPNAVLLAALLLAPTSVWWVLLLLGALPAHLIVELHGGVPASMVASWFVSNCLEALLGATLVRHFIPGRVRLDTVGNVGIFVVCATFLATFVSTFVDAALVTWNGWGQSPYWTVWRIRFLSNMLATQTIVPIVLAFHADAWAEIRRMPTWRRVEATGVAVALVLLCAVAFWLRGSLAHVGPALLFAPIPVLLWSAVRFGTVGISLSLGIVTFLAVWGAVRGGGPFTTLTPAENALSLQLFLFVTGIPLTLLATTIEERRRAELKAAESERLLSLTIKAAHIGLWTADLESSRFSADDVLVRMIGHPSIQRRAYACLIEGGHAWRARTSGEHAAGGYPTGERSAADPDVETLIPERELEVRHADGTVRWILARGMVLRQPDGTALRAMGIAMDITERKRIEQAMRDYDERLSLAATTADIGFWSMELATDEIWLSDQCYTMVGAEPGSAPTAALERLLPRESIGHTPEQIGATFERRATLVEEIELRRHDDTVRWIASSARLERSTAGYPIRVIGVSRDITDQREAERKAGERQLALAHLSRVATVGELTATIVHEVGQPLGAITLNAQGVHRLATEAVIDVPELKNIAADLVRDARRAATVIGQLRDLLRRDEKSREQLDLSSVVQDTLNLARGQLAMQDIALIVSMPDDGPTVLANRAQLQQVLLNVILNARDAILSASPHRRQLVVSVTKGADSVVSVWVADSGGGIAREHLGQVFEPFFTSKPEGLGLGLAVSRSIMIEHGGDLRAENMESGALLQLVLPEFTRPARAGAGGELHGPTYSPRAQPPANR